MALTTAARGPTTVPEDLRLETGMTMSLAEFRRRSAARPDLPRVELVQGVVHVPDDIRAKHHGRPHALMITWLTMYETVQPGVMVLAPATVDLSGDSEPEPDVSVFWTSPDRSRARVNQRDHIEGPPDLIVEISGSSRRLDLGAKFDAYQAAGVKEYLVWLTDADEIHWHVLVEGRYQRLAPDENGVLTSREFPNLRLDAPKLLSGDVAGLIATLLQPGDPV